MSPEQTSTPQDESMATPKMSVPASPVAGTPIRDAQSPISLLLAVAQSHNRNGDDDLTSLSWLHERDLLKGMNINPSPSNSVNSTPVKYNNNNNISNSNNNNNNSSLLSDQFPTSDYVDDSSISAAESSSSSLNSPTPQQQPKSQQQQQQQMYHNGNNSVQRTKHPHNIPYDPLIHTNNKPPYSFSCLIFMAIEDSTQKALPVKEIYAWILEHFPYFKNAPTGWKNSVRHNLSLNKCFQKVEKAPNLGKGSLWTVDQQYRPNLIQALTRSPFHPCSTLDPSIYFNNNNNNTVNNNNGNNKQTTTTIISERTPTRLPNPELYPYLSKKLAASAVQLKNNFVNIKSEPISDESLDAVDAAAVMLSLKNGPRYRQKKEKHLWQVITTSPSQDHTYSAADTAITTTTIQQKQESLIADEAFESDDEVYSKSTICRKLDFDDEEERKIKEGAETLLNLAGITTRKRYNSNNDNGDDYYYNNNNNKCLKLSPKYEIDENDEKPVPFKPRLLRTKKKDSKVIINSNNNNDEWVKHRRELENNQHRGIKVLEKPITIKVLIHSDSYSQEKIHKITVRYYGMWYG